MSQNNLPTTNHIEPILFGIMKKLALNNLGCSKNVVDGETIASFLESSGIQIVEDYSNADIIIVNTCTFIQEATREAIDIILDMIEYKKEGSCSTLVVSGCFSQRYRSEAVKEFEEVDLWVGVDTWQQELAAYFKIKENVSFHRKLSSPLATQYLKISDGCSHGCSYCIIPSIRGSFKSRSIKDIVKEAVWLSEQGVKECIVVSQDTSFYGRDMNLSLTLLLEELLKKTDFHWIRMMYLHPKFVDKELLSLVASEKRICSYFDIPLQHIADPILKRMGRLPLSKGIYTLIDNIRTAIPDAVLRTSFISGFPGETEAHTKQLFKFIEWARFDKLGIFPFSPEPGTKAFTMRPKPQNATVMRRCELLLDLQREISREIQESCIGQYREIIIDRLSDNPEYAYEGRTSGDAPEVDGRVFVIDGEADFGEFLSVQIVDTDDYDMFGKIWPPR